MDLLQAILLGLLQGLTEFIPVSSSGHLVIVPEVFHWPRPGLVFDTVVHLGTLLAVLIYFRHDWLRLALAAWQSVLSRRLDNSDARLAWFIVLGTIPAAVIGALFEDTFEDLFARPALVGLFLLVTAAVLIASEIVGRRTRDVVDMTLGAALAIGLAQAIAIAPGISRSGATIATALALGFARPAAARFSFLLATPIIFGAGLLQVAQLVRNTEQSPGTLVLLAGFVAAAATGYLCIAFLLHYLRQRSLYPFAMYCTVLGVLAATNVLFAPAP